MRIILIMVLACLSACSWFGSRKHEKPNPTEIIVTGAPAGSVVFIDGLQGGQPTAVNDHPQVFTVPPGTHKVEIHVGDAIVYREDTYASPGEHRVVTVLSGLNH